MMHRKNFIAINRGFVCKHCSEKNPKAQTGYRNHCRECLYSLHLDSEIPGDRQNSCHGLMEAMNIVSSARKEYVITHRCQKCGVRRNNKCTDDDNRNTMIELMMKQPFYD